ncbi:MAG: hypothetical protein IJL26_06635 [Clostridia bacterium]|nr:hypothetical protein [Clostridia bacterium]
MNGFSKKLIFSILCAVILCAGGVFAVSTARTQPQTARRPAAATVVGLAQERITLPPTEPTTAVSTAAAQTRSDTTEATAPETTRRETTTQTESRSTLVLTTADDSEPEEGIVAIDRFRLRESKVLPVRANTKITDYLAAKGDARAYTFSAEARGVLQIGFRFDVSEVAGTPWIVYLYEAYSSRGTGGNDAWRLLTRLDVASTESEIVKTEKIGIYPGDYALIVAAGDVYSAADYTLMAAFVSNTPWEAEPNDTRTRYNELTPGVRTGGSTSNALSADRDCYLIEMPAPGFVSLLFEHEKLGGVSVGWFLTLTNERGETIYRQRSFLQDAETASGEIGLDAGYYYLTVEPHIRQDADYYLTCIRERTDDYEKELNDAPGAANELPITERTNRVSGSLSEKDGTPDVDRYRFTLTTDGVISFTFLHRDLLRPRDGWRIVLTNADGEKIFGTTSKWNETTVASPQIGLGAGTYEISVDGEDMLYTNETYTLNVTHAAGRNWETENNDTPDRADPVAPGVIRYGTLVSAGLEYDTDYYSFSIEKTAAVSLTFSHNTVSGTGEAWIVSLTDEAGRVLTTLSSRLETRTVTSALVNLSPGKYYIRVDTGTRFSDVKYGVTLNLK